MVKTELIKLSKSQLKDHWKVPVLLTLIYAAIAFAILIGQIQADSVDEKIVLLLIVLVIATITVVGLPNFYLKFINNSTEVRVKDLFVSMDILLQSLLYVTIYSIVGCMFGSIIGYTVISPKTVTIFGIELFTGSMWISSLIILVSLYLFLSLSMSIALTPFILVDKKEIILLEAIKLSMNMMKGHKWQFLKILLLFTAWVILCILTLGLGCLWISPYMPLIFANFYEKLDKIYNTIDYLD